MNTEAVLEERGKRYGTFKVHAEISQELKSLCLEGRKEKFTNSQIEAIEMICHKIARIVNGDPNYADSWQDISGYATLVMKELEQIEAEEAGK